MRKFIRTLAEYWYIWLGLGSIILLLFVTAVQLYYFKKFKECNRLFVWTRIFLIAFPSFVIFWFASITIPDLFLASSLADHFGVNAEQMARRIDLVISYIGGVLISYFLANWRRKNLPRQRIEFIDNILDRIFSEDERRVE